MPDQCSLAFCFFPCERVSKAAGGPTRRLRRGFKTASWDGSRIDVLVCAETGTTPQPLCLSHAWANCGAPRPGIGVSESKLSGFASGRD